MPVRRWRYQTIQVSKSLFPVSGSLFPLSLTSSRIPHLASLIPHPFPLSLFRTSPVS